MGDIRGGGGEEQGRSMGSRWIAGGGGEWGGGWGGGGVGVGGGEGGGRMGRRGRIRRQMARYVFDAQ